VYPPNKSQLDARTLKVKNNINGVSHCLLSRTGAKHNEINRYIAINGLDCNFSFVGVFTVEIDDLRADFVSLVRVSKLFGRV